MPSQLTGLFRTLTWNDFRQVSKPAPGPGQSADAANTDAAVSSGHFDLPRVHGTQPPQFQLADNITVTISFDAAKSWKASWLATLSQADQNRLLQHEQGHYNLVALLGRDYFLELMQLKAKTYSNGAGFQVDLNALNARFLLKLQPAQDKYDVDTNHGTIQAQQDRWNAFINTAFTKQRTPVVLAADSTSTPLKLPILDVLKDAGINL